MLEQVVAVHHQCIDNVACEFRAVCEYVHRIVLEHLTDKGLPDDIDIAGRRCRFLVAFDQFFGRSQRYD